MRNGILVGGNWIIDQVKLIDAFPQEENLANILEEVNSNGGSAYNLLKDLYKLKVSFPLEGIGLVGDDERGENILRECTEMMIDTKQIRKTTDAPTSYTDVMSVKKTGKRTFFHHRGANKLLDFPDFNFDLSNAKIFHLGYLLLLDKLDEITKEKVTVASAVFKKAKQAGFLTSADIVSENSERFKEIIPSSLPFIDFLFINEFEAKKLTGIDTCLSSGLIDSENCARAAAHIIEMGVQKWVILHFPGGAVAASKNGESIFQPSLNIQETDVEGAVGAGDAFAAGVLTGIHQDWPIDKCLELGVCTAASSLFAATSSDAVLSINESLLLAEKFGFNNSEQIV
ncbi:MAG: carbohydrate kinase family protein [Chitinophagaceae bacterium]